ncbi:MAG: VWA domain-containing protein [Gemmataceae bacterium]|nr:VWA domain-containing protein [Gemmataceae bacterium]
MLPTFTYPLALLLFAFLPLVIRSWHTRPTGSWRFSDKRALPLIFSRRAIWASHGGLWFRLTALALAILALSGPRWTDKSTRLPTEGIAIAMVVDVSVSMTEEDFAWEGKTVSRLVGVKNVFRLFVGGGTTSDGANLPGRRNDLIALVTYATHPETASPVTLDHEALLSILDAQTPKVAANEGTTNPGDAIAWALHVLRNAPTKRKVIVFLTDGEANVPDKLSPRQAAQLAANLNVPIYTIDASPEPKNNEGIAEAARARDMMQTIAKMSGGSYFRAEHGLGLVMAYESIDKLERAKILSLQYRMYQEAYFWFALAALSVLISIVLLEATIWRKVP